MTSSDGQAATVTVQVSGHRRDVSRAILNDVADRLHVSRDQVEDVLANWTPQGLSEHLSSLTQAELRPPSMRR